ncbi:hypothetical protein C5O23_00220 [Duncaniella muris]|uniref:Uncharacterized protein n=1 Tax=Duncaniella muris TaxID=2094150 RepID=A0A2V1IMK6_9BACT|nr:hypothetical protein [Duncaniella muris]PWB04383.1 hypothetical protein C5O23_00220 [Duncaniella muris]RXE73395.1 hypothetical protein ED551_08930 [Muribaculaceae bacterium Isolate-013 (NCI)]
MASNHEIFYAICSLFNEGEVVVSKDIVCKVIDAARHTFPEFVICTGRYDSDKKTHVLYVDNFKDAK